MQTWEVLFERARRQMEAARLSDSCWRFGGGTVLMLEYNHRVSKDVDIFINDRQYLASLSPRLNDALEAEVGRYTEQSNFVRLHFAEGEIDFICAPPVTTIPPNTQSINGKNTLLEHPVEIVAKKVHYRADEFKARDVFDLAMTFHKDRSTLVANAEHFLPHVKVLEERIDTLEKRGELKYGFGSIESLSGGQEICGQEYHLCKLFLWDLHQRSLVVKAEPVISPQRGMRR